MTRKQLYIEARQDKALKRRAKILGISEADLVRRAIDHFFISANAAPAEGPTDTVSAREQALADFLARACAVAQSGHRITARGAHRDELYDERLDRWTQRPEDEGRR
jgi:hypothetical protein